MKTRSVTMVASLIVLLAGCAQESAPAPAPAAVAPEPVQVAETPAVANVGEEVYRKACSLCHAAGVAGAPRPGDVAEWEKRQAQGMDVVYRHAIDGFTGQTGVMPARGGAAALTDDEVKAAVDHMMVGVAGK